jgi:hypothetical protein
MAKNASSQDTVELYMDGPEITADLFTRSVRTFFDLLKDVSADVGGKRTLEWIVSLKPGSIGMCYCQTHERRWHARPSDDSCNKRRDRED